MNTYYLIGLLISAVIVVIFGLVMWKKRQDDLHHGKFTEYEGE